MRSLQTISAILWLFSLISFVHAANWQSHVYERIYLWEMYDLFSEIKGPDNQPIFKQNPKHPWPNNRNIGSGPNGRLTYWEFQVRLQNKGLIPGTIPTSNDLPSPAGGNLDNAASGLLSKGYNGQLNIEFLDPSFKGFKASKNDPHADSYQAFIDKVEKQYTELRKDSANDRYFGPARNKQVSDVANKIALLRRLDTQQWIVSYFKKAPPATEEDKKKGKGGLGLTNVVTRQVNSGIPVAPTFTQVDVPGTFAAYTNPDGTLREELSKNFANQQALIDWIDNQGNPSSGIDYADGSKSHWRAMKSWKIVQIKAGMTLATLRSCN
ncbi:hypothetical protein FB567DRAFT_514042 [Paraphoma chrysanthemicola]|uniref:Uncharacterized protein n=1 Tax=Paraphoma chrysanthemicola TaxID=798071 RepID=A0A8K0RIK7_9PLEO|nr:hypothetical protein FB567DRAFT_514042 [Paraphoma chrysanthemicola]